MGVTCLTDPKKGCSQVPSSKFAAGLIPLLSVLLCWDLCHQAGAMSPYFGSAAVMFCCLQVHMGCSKEARVAVQVETLARGVLKTPIEIQVGGRSVVNSDISQSVEIRPVEDRFLRLLEILGEWYEKGKVLVFVSSQEQCDNLFRDLLKVRPLPLF